MVPDIYMPMLQTAEVVAKRYGISRERQDAYALRSQQLTAKAQAAGVFAAEIVPVTATMELFDKATGTKSTQQDTIAKNEGNRPETNSDAIAPLQTVLEAACMPPGNPQPVFNGPTGCLVMEAAVSAVRGLRTLGPPRRLTCPATQ